MTATYPSRMKKWSEAEFGEASYKM